MQYVHNSIIILILAYWVATYIIALICLHRVLLKSLGYLPEESKELGIGCGQEGGSTEGVAKRMSRWRRW